jgi:hypothetical protein
MQKNIKDHPAMKKLNKAYGKTPDIADEKHLESTVLNTLSSLTHLDRELSSRLSAKAKIKLFEEKRAFLKNNGIENLSTEDLELPIAECVSILKDMIVLYQPKQAKTVIEKQRANIERSKSDSKERKTKRATKALTAEVNKKRGPKDPYIKLVATVHKVCGTPIADLQDKTTADLKRMLKEFMM